jgi:hypothetical protein
VKTAQDWNVPQVVLREAGKQRGTLLVVPEQGMRLQVAAREGYTQLDPQKSGIRQKGVLGFRALQVPADPGPGHRAGGSVDSSDKPGNTRPSAKRK